MIEEWKTEPNEYKFEHRGVLCQILRHPELLHLCGYIRVPDGHPWDKMDYDECDREYNTGVHGGLTYAHREDDGYWIGFDCAHAGDYCPGMYLQTRPASGYKNMAYVTREIKDLVDKMLEVPCTT